MVSSIFGGNKIFTGAEKPPGKSTLVSILVGRVLLSSFPRRSELSSKINWRDWSESNLSVASGTPCVK